MIQKLKILAIPPDKHGVGKYRITDPFIYLDKHYEDLHIDLNYDVPNKDSFFENYNVVVFHGMIHKINHEGNIKRIKWLKKKGIITIMDIDDYWNVDTKHPLYKKFLETKLPKRKIEMLKLVDYVTTTTEYFKNTIKNKLKLNNVFVFPNALDSEEAQFQIKPTQSDKIRFGWLGGSCVTSDTEILTDEGWKYFTDLNENEKVATLNPENNHIEYYKPNNFIKNKHNGKIFQCDTNEISFSVTGNHNMYASEAKNLTHKKLNLKLITCESLIDKNFHVKKDGINNNKDIEYFYLPGLKQNIQYRTDYSRKKIKMDDWLKLFGFWLANGWLTHSNYEIEFCQYKNNNYLLEIKDILIKYNINNNFINDCRLKSSNKQLFYYLEQFGEANEKFIPRFLLNNLSERQLNILLDWYLKGNDSFEKMNGYIRRRGYTVSKQLADDLMELAFKIGEAASIKNRGIRTSKVSLKEQNIKTNYESYQISFYSKKSKHNKLTPLIRKEKIKTKHYDGYVYCVNVKNNIIYIRRNGKAFWCGNSHLHDIKLLRDGINVTHAQFANKIKYVLCGFDTRGTSKTINPKTGEMIEKPIDPRKTSWKFYEDIFTNNYNFVSPQYKKFLMTFKNVNFNSHNEFYERRWTLPINLYGTNYNNFDVSLAPLFANDFNKNKSPLKIIEAGFMKKPIIASEISPYTEDLVSAFNNGKFTDGNALLVDSNKNHKQWTQHIKRFIENPNMIEDLGMKLHETVIDKYSLKTVSKHRYEFFNNLKF